MVTFQIASDLHIEYRNNDIHSPWDYIIPEAEILILAGDIGSFYKINQLQSFLTEVCSKFKFVIYVPGNQEYYMTDGYKPLRKNILDNRIFELENKLKNLHILNQSSLIIDDICITGCTLWSKPEIKLPKYLVRIYGITTELYETYHNQDLNYIEKMINFCQASKLKLVVVTHYCPTYLVLNGSKKRDRFVSLYISNLDYLLSKSQVHTWICGHIHRNFDFQTENETRVIGNQLGKPKDKINDFQKSCLIEI